MRRALLLLTLAAAPAALASTETPTPPLPEDTAPAPEATSPTPAGKPDLLADGNTTYLELRDHQLLHGRIAARQGSTIALDLDDGRRVQVRADQIRRVYDPRSNRWHVLDEGLGGATSPTVDLAGRSSRGVLSFAPLSLLLTFAAIELEGAVTPNLSLYAGGGMSPLFGYSAQAGVRFYPLGAAPAGVFVDGHGVTTRVSALLSSHELSGGGLQLGYTVLLGAKLAVSAGGGIDVGQAHDTSTQVQSGLSCGSSSFCFPLPSLKTRESEGITIEPTFRLMIGCTF